MTEDRSLWTRSWQAAARKSTDRKSTRLNSSHITISYAVFCLKKKKKTKQHTGPNSTELFPSPNDRTLIYLELVVSSGFTSSRAALSDIRIVSDAMREAKYEQH